MGRLLNATSLKELAEVISKDCALAMHQAGVGAHWCGKKWASREAVFAIPLVADDWGGHAGQRTTQP